MADSRSRHRRDDRAAKRRCGRCPTSHCARSWLAFRTVSAPDIAPIATSGLAPDSARLEDQDQNTKPGAGAAAGAAPVIAPERVAWRRGDRAVDLLAKEWLIANGLGGYASGSLAGTPTRRFHGLLVASLRAPLGRTLMLNHMIEVLRLSDGTRIALGGMEPAQAGSSFEVPVVPDALAQFRLRNGLPHWRFERDGVVLEKTVLLPHRQNTALVRYQLLEAPGPVTLTLEPLLDVRAHDGPVAGGPGDYAILAVKGGRAGEYDITRGVAGAPYP